ncbi:MAG: 3-deoxy-D-manno-octulosonic acid kinase [Gammaproteobacteria bacterium]|nr:MAG: 3-deoxy-D-manno-octulosonic acid kinase [Gammaproteobacteria bacterium]
MARRLERLGESVILYDDSLASHIGPALFDPANWPDAEVAPGYAGGRGSTLFIEHAGQQWVLRHYHRGGFMGRWLDDEFPWLGLAHSRAFREWELLHWMQERSLPSPRPVAAHVRRRGLIYRADLVTVRIPDVRPLSTRLAAGPLPPAGWAAVGELIARFHAEGVFHADLTAHNIQIDSQGRLYLLDFDRGRRMPRPGRWQRRNLDRLQRSLRKISGGGIEFAEEHWQALLDAYRDSNAGDR